MPAVKRLQEGKAFAEILGALRLRHVHGLAGGGVHHLPRRSADSHGVAVYPWSAARQEQRQVSHDDAVGESCLEPTTNDPSGLREGLHERW